MTLMTVISRSLHCGRLNTLAGSLLLILLLGAPLISSAQQQTFPTPEAAVEALAAALEANNDAALLALFGEKHRNLVGTGDRAHDARVRGLVAAGLKQYKVLIERGADRRTVLIGTRAWPLPIPIVQQDGRWRFATEEAADEILNRRVGRNERNAIRVLNAYVEAQRQYASRDRNGDGVLEYSQKLASSQGRKDGLYWPAAAGEEASPFGPLIAASAGYLQNHKEGDPYWGYLFRILTRQGRHAAGGAHNYIINGRMIAGYAMVACPADYGDTGVMTFIVNQNGRMFEKNLGPGTRELCAKMTAFDPGPGWKEVSQ